MRILSVAVALTATLMASSAFADVTVYTAGPGGLIKNLAAGFQKQSGIKVNVFQATTGKVMARLEAEAANPVADVVISASWDTATDFDQRGWLLAYTSPNAKTVPDFLKTETAVAEGVSALGIAWNTKSSLPAPKEWSDLAKPEYKDMVNMPDPAASGTAYELVAALQANMGWDLFEKLSANGVNVAGANAAALNPVLQGAKFAVFGAVDYITLAAKAKGETVDVMFPESGTIVAPRPMMILKSTKNAEDAKKFVDYVLSEDGQAMVADTYLMPARTDVEAKRPTINELKLLPASDAAPDREAVLATFSKTFNR